MAAPTSELQAALHAALTTDSVLAALVGTRIFDRAPADVEFPYVSFGRTSLFDWSTATEGGTEQFLTVHVWSKARGKKQTYEIMERVRASLDDAALELTGHGLVNLRLVYAEARFDDDHALQQGVMRFRAVTEPA